MIRPLLAATAFLLSTSFTHAQQPAAPQSTPDDTAQQERREAEFARRLSGATLQGFFSTTEEEVDEKAPELRGERYDLLKVSKGEGNRWLFQSRIRYGDHDVTIPLNLPVEWAGDTPVIVVEDLTIPGMGTFTARVMFHEDHYAGYWSGGDHGGHLIGQIVREKEEGGADPADEKSSAPQAE